MSQSSPQQFIERLFQLMLLIAVAGFPIQGLAEQVDVSGQMTVSKSGLRLNRSSNTFDSAVTLTNSLMPVTAPVRLVVSGISDTSVTLANASGTDANGKPYLNLSVTGTLAPGASLNATLKFSNPQKVSFTFTTQVFAEVQTGSTGTDSVTQAVNTDGGVIDLPGKASLTIPTGSLQSAAIEVAVIAMPELDTLLTEEKNYSDSGAPRLKIKSSAPLGGPVELKIPLPENLRAPSVANKLALFAVEPFGEGDDEGPGTSLLAINGRICENATAYCARLEPGHFLPVPNDPLDPVLRVVLLSKLAAASSTPLNLVHSIDDSQFPKKEDVIDIYQSVNFKVNFDIRKEFPNLRFPSTQQNASILSAFKEIRQAPPSAGRRHTGLDLAVKEQPVVAALDGIADEIRDQPIIAVGADNPTVIQPNYTGDSCRELNDGYGKKIGRIGGLRLSHDFLSKGQLFTRYLHLKPGTINLTDPSYAGDLIATSGTSGACKKPFTCVPNMTVNGVCKLYATGLPAYHLHFDVLSDNKSYIDPRPLLPAINDTSLFLLPHDNVTPDSKDIGGSLEPHLRLGLEFINGDLIPGVKPQIQYVSDFSSIQNIQTANGELQSAVLKGANVGKTKLAVTTDSNGGKYANIYFDSGPLVLGPIFEKALLNQYNQAKGLTIESIIDVSRVTLDLCAYRLGTDCIRVASWDLKRQNRPPVAVDDNATTKINTPVTINVKSNDSDPDGTPTDKLTVINTSVDGGSAKGSVVVNPDGTLTFTPANGVTGNVIVKYQLADPEGAQSNVADVTITVSPTHWAGSYVITECTPLPQSVPQWYWQNPCTSYLPMQAFQGWFFFDDLSPNVILESSTAGIGRGVRSVNSLGWSSHQSTFSHTIPTAYWSNVLSLTPNNDNSGYSYALIEEHGQVSYVFTVINRSPTSISGTFTATTTSGYFENSTNFIEYWRTLQTSASGTWSAVLKNGSKPQTQMNGYDLCFFDNSAYSYCSTQECTLLPLPKNACRYQ